jgi:hypothetical protein
MSAHRPSIIEQRIEWTRFRRQTDKDVLKALARWFCWRTDGSNVRPSSIDALAKKSGVPKRSVNRALARLSAGGYLRVTATQHRGTSTYQIVCERLATEDPDRVTIAVDNTRPFERHSGAQTEALSAKVARKTEFERQSGAQVESGAQEKWPDFEKVALQYVRTEVVGEEICTPPPPPSVLERHSGAQTEAVTTFAAWWNATYPLHHAGIPNPIDAVQDGATIHQLLCDYPVDLQAMTLLMWQIVADRNDRSDRSWIARSDHGLRVLARKAAFLHLALRAPAQLTFGPMEEVKLTAREIEEAKTIRTQVYLGRCPHDPTCIDWKDCVREIALARHVS